MKNDSEFWIAYRREPDGTLRALGEVKPEGDNQTPEEVLRQAKDWFPSTVEVRKFSLNTV